MGLKVEREWVPKTRLGKSVAEGKIQSMEEIFAKGWVVREPEIVDALLPELSREVIGVERVQRQTDAGPLSSLRVIVAVGDNVNYVGIAKGKGRGFRDAFYEATERAKLNLTKVRKGCGSWECGCGNPHSIPMEVTGKVGSVKVKLLPAPRGVGLVGSEVARIVLTLGGIKDIRVFSRGNTSNRMNYAFAVCDALRNLSRMQMPSDWRTH